MTVAVPFDAHVALLRFFLAQRAPIVERIAALLNAQRQPAHHLRDTALLARRFADCFFTLRGVTPDQAALERQLDEAHWTSGFKPRPTPGQHNDLIDPAEMMGRAFHLWQQTRWPGQHGRSHYAHTLFNLYLLRRLMLLGMRIWDEGPTSARGRLAEIQAVLDELWHDTPADQPVLVRDARWLFALAQSPTTDELAGYFVVAERLATTLPSADALEIHRANVRMAGGHLRSQLRHVATQKGVSLDDHELVLSTRRSNALDLATLVQGLVPLLEAYEAALASGDDAARLTLADAILQGISPDPELFVNRLELLGPYTIIDYLFAAIAPDGSVALTPAGQRHARLLEEYVTRVRRVSRSLHADCAEFRPAAGTYSPYGALYGFSSQLLEHMALKASQPDAVTKYGLEDVFTQGGPDKLAWVSGWRKLPHIPREVLKLFEYPQAFAEDVFGRIERALAACAASSDAAAAPPPGRLFIEIASALPTEPHAAAPPLPVRYVVSSDRQLVSERRAQLCDETQLLHSRTEGELLISYRTPGGWLGITKDVLTELLGAGRDATITGVPSEVGRVLALLYPELVAEAAASRP